LEKFYFNSNLFVKSSVIESDLAAVPLLLDLSAFEFPDESRFRLFLETSLPLGIVNELFVRPKAPW
jgi:hypothetical protein